MFKRLLADQPKNDEVLAMAECLIYVADDPLDDDFTESQQAAADLLEAVMDKKFAAAAKVFSGAPVEDLMAAAARRALSIKKN